MKRPLSITLCTVLLIAISIPALAKRIGPKPLAPVEADGVRYVAPNDSGREGRVEAQDAKTGKKLWDAVVYTVTIDPNLEEDVQWVFVTKLEVKDGVLRVTNEKDQAYSLDLKTREIKKPAVFIEDSGSAR